MMGPMSGPASRIIRIFQLLLWNLLFYFFARLEFFLWNFSQLSSQTLRDVLTAFVAGMRFDISAILALLAPLILLALIPWPYRLQRTWAFISFVGVVVLQTPLYILNLVDSEFINFVGRRFTYDSLFLTKELSGKLSQFVATYWHLFAINTFLVSAFLYGAYRILYRNKMSWSLRHLELRQWGVHLGLSFLALVVAVIGIRGGLQGKPLSFVNANLFAAPMMNNLVLNTSFTFIKSYGAKELPQAKYFQDEKEMLSWLNGAGTGSVLQASDRQEKSNVIIIILESFGSEYFGQQNGKSFTPFLDELRKKSLDFPHAFANGRRSIEGIAAILSGIPALMQEPFISSQYTSNHFIGLGNKLLLKGYHTSFFHGGRNGTMHFDAFMPSVGVENYFGANEYANSADDDGTWGIWDEPFLQWMLQQLATFKEPFFSTVFTLSSHHPFKVPEVYKNDFSEGEIPILKTISYTDMALKKFFAEAEKQSWYENTLFVITADHTSLHYRKEYENEWGNYSVPLLFFHPRKKLPETTLGQVVQHIDIPSSIYDFLNLEELEKSFLGSSVFQVGDKVAVNFIDGRYVLFASDLQLYWWPHEESPRVYAMTDHGLKNELEIEGQTLDQKKRVEVLFNKMKAVVQYYNSGIMENRLFYPLEPVKK